MHEVGIAEEIYRVCRQSVEANGGGRLARVRVAVGELSAVEPDLLEFAWRGVVAGGPDESAELVIEWRPAVQVCTNCGHRTGGNHTARGAWLSVCPQCGGLMSIEGGRELDIIDLTIEEGG
ncbi:MAG: hydrogenase maturation nickel metallochaperone HypA [Candidatus Zixiibacteriota bacterium]|nr:MAG: hydrogenase maturation nickel metallochaperone HypA [candidate division Zixibacteria bacterium]